MTSAANGVRFDFFGDGKLVQIAWTQANSTNGWLALDRNGNGTIDSAEELFGNITEQPQSSDPNGYLALAVFDEPQYGGNGDGIIDAHDAVWPKLVVWIDSNHDGVSQPGELHHLDDLGIHSIGLMYKESRRVDAYGNVFRYKGSLNLGGNGQAKRVIYDVILTGGGLAQPPQAASALTSGRRGWFTLERALPFQGWAADLPRLTSASAHLALPVCAASRPPASATVPGLPAPCRPTGNARTSSSRCLHSESAASAGRTAGGAAQSAHALPSPAGRP
ncbi:MAG TPA: hypothetical protein VND90_13400 [Terracidiphilus sp.]|nr:hypothetical protein [Terracidiphilus sp.]